MSSKAKKLVEKLRRTKRNWSCGDLTDILESTGFEWRESKHRVFRHPEFPELGSYPIPRRNGLPPAYAKDVLGLVQGALALYQAQEEEEKKEDGK